jgi:hypothetical protein
MNERSVTLELHLHADTPEEQELFSRGVLVDLDSLGLDAVPAPAAPVPQAAKGLESFNQWLITLAASGGILTTLTGVLTSRLTRDRRATLVIGNDRLELTGLDADQQRRLIDAWLKRQRAVP